MKAIFSTLGRRVNVERRQDTPETPRKSKSANPPSSSSATQPRATYLSFSAPDGGIGDAPAKPSYNASTTSHQNAGHTWESKFSSSPQDTPHALRSSYQNSAYASSAQTSPSTSRPSHPPSSYRDPSRQTSSASATARGLVRKWSNASRRTSSPSNGSNPQHATSSTLSQLPASNGPGSTNTRPSSKNGLQSAATPSGHGPHNPSVAKATTSDVTRADISVMTSEELATRLNELAVANADGLLTDDEYRTLRQAVFDQMLRADKQSMAPPTENGLIVLGSQQRRDTQLVAVTASNASNGNTYLSADPLSFEAKRSGSSLGHGDHGASSIRSARSGKASSFQSVSNLFRNGSTNTKAMDRQNSQDSHSSHQPATRDAGSRATPIRRDSSGVTSQLSSGDGHSQRALSFRTQQSSAAKSSRISTFGRLRAGSQARREQSETAMRDMEESFSAERAARSLRAVSLYDAGGADFSQLGNTSYDKSTATSLRAEMAPTTMFGAEYADRSTQEIQAEMGVVQAEGARMLNTFTMLEQTLLSRQTSMEPVAVKRVMDSVREAHPLACVSSLAMPDREGQGLRSARPPPPSSYRPPHALNPLDGSPSHDPSAPSAEATTSAEYTAFATELASIYAQKAAVVKRYQDRLAFLQSKLRSAAIRECLK